LDDNYPEIMDHFLGKLKIWHRSFRKVNIEGAILFLDFTKAFDSLEWSFMTECLKKFGFKSSFIRWIRTMYTDIKGCILNNGWVSAPFKDFRGIRQGYVYI
jgi:hypothetical protein